MSMIIISAVWHCTRQGCVQNEQPVFLSRVDWLLFVKTGGKTGVDGCFFWGRKEKWHILDPWHKVDVDTEGLQKKPQSEGLDISLSSKDLLISRGQRLHVAVIIMSSQDAQLPLTNSMCQPQLLCTLLLMVCTCRWPWYNSHSWDCFSFS